MLLAMPMLTASPEMKEVAMADEPKKETTYYGHTYTTRTYFAYMNCLVQDGILKAAFFLPDHLRLDGNNPVYEVFLDKENRQFLTYDHLEKKWRDAKLDRLEWHGRNYYATCWFSEEDAALVQDYFSGERGGDLGILDFQRNVRDEQLERRHKRITDRGTRILPRCRSCPRIGRLGRQGGRARKLYLLPLQTRRSQNRLLHLLREGGAHFRASLSQQNGALHLLPTSRNVQGPGTRRLLQNRPVLCLSGPAMQGWFCHPGILGRQNLSKGYPAAQ